MWDWGGIPPDLHVCTKEDVVGTQVVGWLLTVGALVSFFPQIFTLIIHKNLEGLSALTWALNYLSNMATMVNAVMLNWTEIQCCEELPAGECLENLVPLVQLFGPAICTFAIFFLTTLYHGYMTEEQKLAEDELHRNSRKSLTDFFAYLFGTNHFITQLFIASLFITILLGTAGALLLVFLDDENNATVLYAQIIGILAVLLLLVMYIPQLYTTYKVKHTGSLSVTTLLIQAPGSLMVVYFDAIQSKLSWTTWAPYLVSGLQQFVLIGMCIYYYMRNKSASGKKTASESDPLLKTQSDSISIIN